MSGQEENKKYQIPFGKNQPWANTSAGGSAPSGGSGISSRKVINKDNIIETRYYLDGFELYRREVNGAIDYERTTLNISDEEKVFVRVEKKTNEPEVVRYQYDNHLGSACLELDYTGRIISYEEYHPFGTTSYRSGRSETEVSLKRYKYCGKERDEQTGFYYYGMRYYAGWLCRFVSVDPLQFEYPGLTPYAYCGNNPIKYIDPDGRNPIDPRTGKEISMNLYTAAVYDSYSNQQITAVMDKKLYDSAEPYNYYTQRKFCEPDGVWEGSLSLERDYNLSRLSSGAITVLKALFPNIHDVKNSSATPHDYLWMQMAEQGSYVYVDNSWTAGLWLRFPTKDFNIITVTKNYITQIVNLTRNSRGENYNINSVTTFDIVASNEQSRQKSILWFWTKTEKYKTLTVTETTQNYVDNKPDGTKTVRTYQTEEIVE